MTTSRRKRRDFLFNFFSKYFCLPYCIMRKYMVICIHEGREKPSNKKQKEKPQ
nr:MAG TPA: hypothetical protein [Caudoviricetes sp.]